MSVISKDKTDFGNNTIPVWCPGCGCFGTLASLKSALQSLDAKKENVVLVGDIGCSSNLPNHVNVNSFNGLHGRAVPLATGIKLANHDLTVIAIGGDGGIYGEGGNHLLHASRRNVDMTLLVSDNKVYSLTKGQTSPTSDQGFKSSVTPDGSPEIPLNPISIALASGASFVARGFAGDINHLSSLISEAVRHKGFALIDILQPCISLNHINTLQWYTQRLYKLDQDKGYDGSDLTWAFKKAQEWGERIPIGIFYRKERPLYEDQLSALKSAPLTTQTIDNIDISSLLPVYR